MANMVKHYSPRGHRLRLDFSARGAGVCCGYALKMQIRAAIAEALFYERYLQNAQVSVTLCDNKKICELNVQYRNRDAVTDVLSFPMYGEGELPGRDTPAEGEYVPLGDIVISRGQAAEQAAELGHSTEREIAFLCIHSTLHLLGYDHEKSAADEEDMCARQRTILKNLNFYEK